MGLYIQCGTNKVQWCTDNGKVLQDSREAKEYIDNPVDDSHVVCVVDNVAFQAAAVMFAKLEFAEWCEPGDPRRKYWFLIKDEVIQPLCPEWHHYIKE